MREILFRGKSSENGEWIYGSLIKRSIGSFIVDEANKCSLRCCGEYDFHFNSKLVKSETIGQYTGLLDKNGKKIFEGDIVKGKDLLEKALEVYGYIDHKNGSFVIVGDFMTHYRWLDYEVEVIGNIHDNPELLKEGAEE